MVKLGREFSSHAAIGARANRVRERGEWRAVLVVLLGEAQNIVETVCGAASLLTYSRVVVVFEELLVKLLVKQCSERTAG